MPRIPTNNYANHFDPSKAHHRAFFQAVLDRVDKLDPKALQEGGDLRELWKAAVETKAPAIQQPAWLPAALKIIREFEGCRLKAYRCPAGVWTIGWGSTRLPGTGAVRSGDVITQEDADRLLAAEVVGLFGPGAAALVKPWKRLAPNAQAALVSFAYNVGLGAFEESTLLRRLNAGHDPNAVAREELPRWVKGEGGRQLDGLVRRRTAEIALFVSGATVTSKELTAVPQYYSQRDNGAQSDRSCFSATAAMLIKLVKPSALQGSNADLDYLKVVNRFGDTTDPAAQVKALATFGVTARLVKTSSWDLINQQVKRWGGCGLGWIHRGPVAAPDPACDGHWGFCYGIDATHLTMHDPYLEADLVNGGFVLGRSGQSVRYSRKNFGRRWMVSESPRWQYAPGHGWALVIDAVN
jgi:GH24 family phage-related lysozyme (muramidase)